MSLLRDYLMVQCATSQSLTLHSMKDYVVSPAFYRFEGMLAADAILTQFDENTSRIQLI